MNGTHFKILNKAKKQKILDMLKQYGIEKLNYLLLQTDSKLRIFSGMISKSELFDFLRGINIDNVGLYFASLQDSEARLNIDAVHLLANQISKNILQVGEEQAERWFHGQEIELNEENKKDTEKVALKEGFIILRNKEDFIGIGKLTKTRILNYLPKERRIKH